MSSMYPYNQAIKYSHIAAVLLGVLCLLATPMAKAQKYACVNSDQVMKKLPET